MAWSRRHPKLHLPSKCGFPNRTIFGTHWILFLASLRIPFLEWELHPEWPQFPGESTKSPLGERWGTNVSTARGKVIWLSSASGGREMRGESMSGTTMIGTTLLRLALICHLLRGATTGLSFSDLREDLEVVTCELEVRVTFSDLKVQLGDLEIVTGVLEVAVSFSDLEVVDDLKVVSSLEVVGDLEVVSWVKVVSSDLKVGFSDLKVGLSDLVVGFRDLKVGFSDLKVVSGLEVVCELEAVTNVMQAVVCMISHLAVMLLSPAGWTAHVFTIVVFVPPRSIGA
jgi:hypothetical protein